MIKKIFIAVAIASIPVNAHAGGFGSFLGNVVNRAEDFSVTGLMKTSNLSSFVKSDIERRMSPLGFSGEQQKEFTHLIGHALKNTTSVSRNVHGMEALVNVSGSGQEPCAYFEAQARNSTGIIQVTGQMCFADGLWTGNPQIRTSGGQQTQPERAVAAPVSRPRHQQVESDNGESKREKALELREARLKAREQEDAKLEEQEKEERQKEQKEEDSKQAEIAQAREQSQTVLSKPATQPSGFNASTESTAPAPVASTTTTQTAQPAPVATPAPTPAPEKPKPHLDLSNM
ncbi:hypothetical protein [Komagataeibacter nataicola]|uniref:hypothetical protein n=1 Tax=Komagataeibacter nataicola TaxID=265960 RepID=UPI0011B466BC|nr:hypothetical protein [Komagataeibacter nataicola]WNM10351.1 hypothetical protein RI056_18805 [Komagataeibacter nataicola]GBR23529.1 hypothetical protein AA0616_2545 [Komagataeibacter nataicola NRIC 0616]